VTDRGAARKAFDVVGRPAVLVHEGCDEQRWIRDPPGDDDVRTACERGQQRFRAEIRVGGHDRRVGRERNAALQRARGKIERIEHVVAGDRRDLDGNAQAARDVDDRVGRRQRIGRAEIADERDAASLDDGQKRLDALGQASIVAACRITPAAQLRERDGALGQALEDEIVELAALGQVERRIEAIARESRAAAQT
jgi:hypothetical protein